LPTQATYRWPGLANRPQKCKKSEGVGKPPPNNVCKVQSGTPNAVKDCTYIF